MMTNQTVTNSQTRTILVPHKRGETQYFVKGTNPKLLLLSGMHGDEYEVSEQLTQYVQFHAHELPDFLFIPQASTSAVRLKTRINAYGNDLNRSFVSPVLDNDAKTLISILKDHSFTLCLDFHEDGDRYKSFYLYDSGELSAVEQDALAEAVRCADFSLYTGIDDEADANLGLMIRQGYISTPPSTILPTVGFLSPLLVSRKIVNRMFTLEIPGKADPAKKAVLVSQLFSFFLSQSTFLSYERTSVRAS